MLEWIRKKRPPPPAAAAVATPATELVGFLLEQLPAEAASAPLAERVERFRSLPPAEQECELPGVYLFLEQALVDAGGLRLDRAQLRGQVVTAFDHLLAEPGFRLIFEPPELQQLFLCRKLLSTLLERSFEVLGAAGDNLLKETLAWLAEVPDRAADPIPFGIEAEQPRSTGDWIRLLTLITRALYDRVERILGRQASRRMFERGYDDLARSYLGLPAFSVVLGLLPEKLLDERKIRELNRGQMQQVVLDKVEHLERANQRLQDNNRQLEAAQRALEKANEELEERVRDRTEALRMVNEHLRESEEKLRQITAAAHDAIVMLDDRGRVSFWNAAAERVFGFPKTEILGQDFCRTLMPRRFHGDFRQRLRTFGATGEGLAPGETIEGTAVGRDRDEFPVELSLSSVKIQGRWHALAVVRDITERRRAEEERRRLEERMQENQRLESLGLLAGGIAHDFNNLLASILGNAGLAKRRIGASGAAENLAQIETATARAAELTQQMLAYSGRGHFVVEPCDLSELVEEMAQLLEVSISRRATFERDLAAGLPAVEADLAQVRQVVVNLVANASEALEDAEGSIGVRTGVQEADRAELAACELGEELEEGRYVFLEVEDTGSGMDDATRAKIFDPFFSTRFVGRGLGLAAVLGIVRGHRGAIRISSRPGEGTRVRVLFPAVAPPAAERQAVAPPAVAPPAVAPPAVAPPAVALPAVAPPAEALPAEAPPAEAPGSRGTVLVVDDEPSVREMVSRALEVFGFQVLDAEDGQQAVDVFSRRGREIDLVLMDLTMPRMNGKEAFLKMRELRADARVILSSGYSREDVLRELDGEKPTSFLQKPYDLAALAAEVSSALEPGD